MLNRAIITDTSIEIELPGRATERTMSKGIEDANTLIEIELPGGAMGKAGPKGDPGVDGTTYTPEISSTSTLEPGSEATVSVSIDEEAEKAYYDFGIPKGDKGDKGDIGDTYFTTFDVVDGKLIAYYSREDRDYNFRLNGNKLEVVFSDE